MRSKKSSSSSFGLEKIVVVAGSQKQKTPALLAGASLHSRAPRFWGRSGP